MKGGKNIVKAAVDAVLFNLRCFGYNLIYGIPTLNSYLLNRVISFSYNNYCLYEYHSR